MSDLKTQFVKGYVDYLKKQSQKKEHGFNKSDSSNLGNDNLKEVIDAIAAIEASDQNELLKILKTINKLPRYECYDPAKNEFRPHCIPDVDKSEIEYTTLNRESNDGAKYITARAMKIVPQAITTDGDDLHDKDEAKENFVKLGDEEFKALFKDNNYVVQEGGQNSTESQPSEEGPKVKTTDKTLYELVDEFGQNRVNDQENVEGQFSANIIRSRDEENKEYTDEIITKMGKQDINEDALAEWDKNRVQEPYRMVLKGKKR